MRWGLVDLDGVPRGGDVARRGKGRASRGRNGTIEVSRDAVVIVGPGIPPLPDPLWSRLGGGRLDHDCIEGDDGGEDIAKVSNEELRSLDPSTLSPPLGREWTTPHAILRYPVLPVLAVQPGAAHRAGYSWRVVGSADDKVTWTMLVPTHVAHRVDRPE